MPNWKSKRGLAFCRPRIDITAKDVVYRTKWGHEVKAGFWRTPEEMLPNCPPETHESIRRFMIKGLEKGLKN